MICFGEVPAGSVLPIAFTTYGKTNGESITLTGLAVTDIEVYKGTSMTQRASDNGYALIDTDGIDIDSVTGFHGFSIDLGDNTDAGFYAAGSFYTALVSAVTIDSQTVSFIAATFRIKEAETVAGRHEVRVASIANGVIAAATFAANALDAVWSTATRILTAGTNIALAKGIGVTGFNDLSAAQVNAEADTALADVGLTTTVTGRIDAAISSRLATAGYTAPLDAAATRAAVGLGSANLDTQLADKTGYALTASYDFAKGTAAMTEAYAANGAAPTPVQALYAIHQTLMDFAISGTTISVKKLDHSTQAFAVTINSATTPTSANRT